MCWRHAASGQARHWRAGGIMRPAFQAPAGATHYGHGARLDQEPAVRTHAGRARSGEREGKRRATSVHTDARLLRPGERKRVGLLSPGREGGGGRAPREV